MIDFTNCQVNKFKYYGGANGGKLCIKYQDNEYMLKFPSPKEMIEGYTNSSISEYLTCHIFKLLGVKVQETLLGEYKINDKTKIVVACKDFTTNGFVLSCVKHND